MTLALARLVDGHDRTCAAPDRLGPRRAVLGVSDRAAARLRLSASAAPKAAVENGAVFTKTHVSRGADFIAAYLPTLGFGAEAPMAARLVHFTGYEMEIDDIRVERPAGPHGRLPGRHRRPDRPDVGPHVPREMPRVPLPGVRLGQDRARAPARRPRGGALRLARGPDHQDAGLLRVRRAHAHARRSSAASTATPSRISTARASTRPRSTATWISCAETIETADFNRLRRTCYSLSVRPDAAAARLSAKFVTRALKSSGRRQNKTLVAAAESWQKRGHGAP